MKCPRYVFHSGVPEFAPSPSFTNASHSLSASSQRGVSRTAGPQVQPQGKGFRRRLRGTGLCFPYGGGRLDQLLHERKNIRDGLKPFALKPPLVKKLVEMGFEGSAAGNLPQQAQRVR